MTTKEMIEVLQAFDRGEEIEYKPKNREGWALVNKEFIAFDFGEWDYRIKPKEEKRKFKVGDLVTLRSFESKIINSETQTLKILEVSDGYVVDAPPLTNEHIPFEEEHTIIKVDDCLWYWEWYDENDECYKNNINNTRYTGKGIIEELEKLKYNITTKHQPVYTLGFKLPKDIK